MEFKIGFWHPFGPHAGETAGQILKRKSNEIKKNKWTLWSFSNKTPATMELWLEEIKDSKAKKVFVFCSDGKGTTDPVSKVKLCKHYTPVGTKISKVIPSAVSVPHPMGKKSKGAAFIVKKVYYPTDFTPHNLDWFFIGGKRWQNRRSSTFGEHLIRPGKGKSIGKYQAILELKYPYLAEVSS